MRLFDPLNINGMVVPNRVMVPAMVTHLCHEDGVVTQDSIDRYTRYAIGGTGLIVAEAMAIHGAKSGPLLRISDDKFIPGLRELTKNVHGCSDSKIVPQIIHFMKVAKSGWRQTIDSLSEDEIKQIIDEFGNAAVRSREAGFDGVELHSAHAYTLSSFLSRCNPRKDEFGGQSIENRMRMIGCVMETVRRKVGKDYPVGVRFNAEEFIKNGYTVNESKEIALRLAELGFDYISLSVGGKFDDAVHTPGQVLFPYSGYSGDRCMPGNWFPMGLHADLGAEIKAHLIAHNYTTPVAIAGKLSDPGQAEQLIAENKTDMVAIARGLLADPDWPNKVKKGDVKRIVHCDYCNVCKNLDGTHNPVICALWPKNTIQAPIDCPDALAPEWGEPGGNLTAISNGSSVTLRWGKVKEANHYDVYRTDEDGKVQMIDATRATGYTDNLVLSGRKYRYHIVASSISGQTSLPSQTAVIDITKPSYM